MIDTVKTGANQDATTNGVQTSRSTAHSKSSTSTPSSRHSAGSNGTSRSNGHSVRPHREPTPSANRQLGAKRFRIRWRRLGILLLLIAGALVLGRYGLSWADYRWKYSVTHEASVVGDKQLGEPVKPATDTPLGGFELAGTDGQWCRAAARIDGQHVIVTSEDVANPIAVRYAWGPRPKQANLYNQAGFPAAPFNTNPRSTAPSR